MTTYGGSMVDPGDGRVMRTVTVIDGLGRAILTAKDGASRTGTPDGNGP